MEVRRVCVVGAGTVGSQLAYQCALSGVPVRLASRSPETLMKGVSNAARVLQRRVDKGSLTEAELEAAMARVHTTTSIDEAASDADFVVEAVAERLDVKRAVFQQLDG